MRCFLDLDGILGDFDRHILNCFGNTPRELEEEKMWELVKETSDFWLSMPVKWGAHALLRTVQALNPVVLTGCPSSDFDRAEKHKIEWVAKHFGDLPVITCRSREKPRYMTSTQDILIDDFRSNLRNWQKAGGKIVHYRDSMQARTDFNRIVLQVGDLVQVLINDSYVLEKPELISDIYEHQNQYWVFINGSKSGIQLGNVVLVKKGKL
jgi:hypothetical protein